MDYQVNKAIKVLTDNRVSQVEMVDRASLVNVAVRTWVHRETLQFQNAMERNLLKTTVKIRMYLPKTSNRCYLK